jgi:hypothetical protein
MRLALVAVLIIVAVEVAALFVMFVPVVHETAALPCYMPCGAAFIVVNYSASISYQYFGVGFVYGACDSHFQLVFAKTASPSFCQTTS